MALRLPLNYHGYIFVFMQYNNNKMLVERIRMRGAQQRYSATKWIARVSNQTVFVLMFQKYLRFLVQFLNQPNCSMIANKLLFYFI